jgi:hypothetical protein
MEEQQEYIEGQVQKSFVLRQMLRLLGRLTAWVLLLLFVFLLIFQIPGIQNWLADKVTTSIAQKSETTVEIERAYLSFFDHLVLKNVYIEDYRSDTLLFAKALEVDFKLNPYILLTRGLEIEMMGLQDAVVKIQKPESNYLSNIEEFTQKLFATDKDQDLSADTTARKPFRLGLDRLDLNRVRFFKYDQIKGNKLDIFINRGVLTLNKLNLPDKIIDVKSAEIDGMDFFTESYEAKPLNMSPGEDHPQNNDSQNESANNDDQTAVADSNSLKILINNIALDNGSFTLHNYYKAPVKTSPDDELDFKHLEIFDIGIQIDSFEVQDLNFAGKVNCLSGQTSSGFVLDELSVQQAMVTPERATLNGLKIITPYSEIGDTLVFRYKKYPDFKEFVDEVRMTVKVNNSFVALRDIMTFAPGLKRNVFFANNRNTVLKLDGRVSGKVNNLRAKDLDIILPDGSKIAGNFGSRNLAVRTQEMVNVQLTELRTTMRTLKQLIPDFSPPENFDRLGRLYFTGRFDGFFADFVAFGDLRSDIGRAKMDMQMNLLEGSDKAQYRGELSLYDFDLGTWTQNPNLGLVNFSSRVENGSGLTAETATADLQANIESFYFKNYNYQNANLTGKLNQNFFNGDFTIQDQHIDFSFKGEIDLKAEVPTYDFKANVRKMALLPLNLSDQNITLAGDLDLNLRNKKLADLTGKATVNRFSLKRDDEQYDINSIVAESTVDIQGEKVFILFSEVVGARIEGKFKIDQLPKVFTNYIAQNFTGFAERMNIRLSEKAVEEADFSFNLNIIDSKGLNWLVSEKLGILEDVRIDGFFNGPGQKAMLNLEAPGFKFGNLAVGETFLDFNGQDSLAQIDMEVYEVLSKDRHLLPTLNLAGRLQPDSLGFKVSFASDSPAFFDNLALQGILSLPDSTHFGLSLLQSNLMIFESPWLIDPRNRILFSRNDIRIDNFELRHEDKFLKLTHLGEKGINLKVSNLEYSYIDDVWDYDPLDFGGKYDLNLNVQDLFKLRQISAWVRSDAFYINGDNYGQMELDLYTKDLKGRLNTHMVIAKDDIDLTLDGFYNIQSASSSRKIPEDQKAKYFDFNLTVNNYPLDFARYFVAPEVKNIVGTFDVNFFLKGMFPKPDISGNIVASNGAFTVDYLKTRYSFDTSYVVAGPTLFDASGTIIKDKFGNVATLSGGISHNYLKDLGVAAKLSTERFLALETQKEDNSLFYGTALGAGEVDFNGRFSAVDIYVNASVDDETNIIVPVTYDKDATQLNSIRFVNKHEEQEEVSGFLVRESPQGISVEMDLSVRENAVMELIFDEQLGDIIRGQGRGNIRMLVPRGGEFQMFGIIPSKEEITCLPSGMSLIRTLVCEKEGLLSGMETLLPHRSILKPSIKTFR